MTDVQLADLRPITRFIAAVCRADAGFQTLTRGEVSQLPANAALGMSIIAEAVAALGLTPGPAAAQVLGPWPPGSETKDPGIPVRPAGPGIRPAGPPAGM